MKEKIENILKDDRTSRSQIWIIKEEFEILLPTFEQVELEIRKKAEEIKKRAMWWWRKSVISWIKEKLFFNTVLFKSISNLWWSRSSLVST